MSLNTRVLHIIMVAIALAGGISCSKEKTKSDLVDLTVNPDEPIVITAPSKDGNGQDISPPWFDFRLSLTNPTAEQITVVALLVKVYGPSGTSPKEVAMVPADFNFSLDEDTECKFTYFGTWQPGQTLPFSLAGGGTDCDGRGPIFNVSALPKGTNNNSYRYRVEIKPLGWFGPIDNASDRFEKKEIFFTQ